MSPQPRTRLVLVRRRDETPATLPQHPSKEPRRIVRADAERVLGRRETTELIRLRVFQPSPRDRLPQQTPQAVVVA